MSSTGPSLIQLNSLIAPVTMGLEGPNEEPARKRARVEQKTRDEVLAESKERQRPRRLPPLGKNAMFDEQFSWYQMHYTKEPLADYETQLLHWNKQTVKTSLRTFKHEDGKETPSYNNLQTGHSRATALSPEEQQIVKIGQQKKHGLTRAGRRLGQMNWLECAGFKAYVKFMQALGYIMVRFERMPDCVIVDFCAIMESDSGLVSAPVQVKVARGPPGTQVHFHVNKADGAANGRYEDHILICLVVDVSDDANLDCKDFDELPDVDILEAYIMQSSDIKSLFAPVVYDHQPGSKRGRGNAYEAFRYVVGRDQPEKLDNLMRSLESNIQEIWGKRKWTRDDCFFKFGAGSPNTIVQSTKQTELLGMKAVSEALKPFEARSPLRHGETVDILFWRNSDSKRVDSTASSVRISLKTATFNNLNKDTGHYSGFKFILSTAPNADHCDIVVAVQFDLENKTKVVAAYVFDSTDVYNRGLETLNWNKSAHRNKKFNLTNNIGCQGFKDHVSSFMKTDKQRREPLKK